MTLLVASLFGESVEDATTGAQAAWNLAADAVELRIDDFQGDPSALAVFLRKNPDRTWIVTCRGATEGGRSKLSSMERATLVSRIVEGTDAIVDVELADWQHNPDVRKTIEAAIGSKTPKPRLILSSHREQPDAMDLAPQINKTLDENQHAVVKAAYTAKHISDAFAALDAMHDHNRRCMAIAMGEEGAWTRVLAKKLGAFASFASLTSDAPTASGQWTIRELRDHFGWERINAGTRVFGVIGDPVSHSFGPLLFNHWFAKHDVNAVYLPFPVRNGKTGLAAFLRECEERPWLDIGGFSVTIPHKSSALAWLADAADPMSQGIGAVNTICLGPDGPMGYNTDCYAAVGSLCDALGCDNSNLADISVDVLGAGGAARAVLYGLHEFGCRVTVFARSPDSVRLLTEQFSCTIRPWNERIHRTGEVVINCTPLGMHPGIDATPLPPQALARCRLAFDLIYRPNPTRFLNDASAAGCRTLSGLDMYLRQAAMQFELWTGKRPCLTTARLLLRQGVDAEDRASSVKSGGKPSIALIGYRGCGKTTVGRALAELLGGRHVDTDDLIVQTAGRTIAQIFAEEGEAGFRRRETQAIRILAANPPAVLSVGGGAVMEENNVEAIRSIANIVWLTAPVAVLRHRLEKDASGAASRPGLTPLGTLAEIETVLAAREPYYRRAADFTLNASNDDPKELARQILRLVTSFDP